MLSILYLMGLILIVFGMLCLFLANAYSVFIYIGLASMLLGVVGILIYGELSDGDK